MKAKEYLSELVSQKKYEEFDSVLPQLQKQHPNFLPFYTAILDRWAAQGKRQIEQHQSRSPQPPQQTNNLTNAGGEEADRSLVSVASAVLGEVVDVKGLAQFYGQQPDDPERSEAKKEFDKQRDLVVAALHKKVVT